MAIGRITGPMLQSNLERQGINVAIDANLIYADVTNRFVGISTASPQYALDVNGNAHLGNLYVLGNTISSDAGANISGTVTFSSITNSTNINTGAVIITGGTGIQKDLWVGGNIYANSIIAQSSNIFAISDPLLYLSASNPSNYNYEIGFYGHFVGGSTSTYQHTGLIRNHTDNYWYVFSNAAEPVGSTVNLSNAFIILDTIKSGGLILANTTPSTSTSTGALQVAGGVGIAGVLWLNNTNDVSANIGAYQVYANANAASQQNNISTINANLGAYQIYANANIGTLSLSSISVNANLGAYQTYANTSVNTINSNLGAYQTYANTSINTINANLGAYQIYANANASSQQTSLNSINANLGAFESYANLYVGSAAYGNANVATYLPTYTGNLNPTNLNTSVARTANLAVDTIYSNVSGVITFALSSAIGLPIGGNSSRPGTPASGQIRFNSDLNTLEFYAGAGGWMSMNNTITDQQFSGDGLNNIFTLNQSTSSSGILVSINGTIQQPGLAYTVLGTQITFSEIPQTSDVIDIRYLASATAAIYNNIDIDSPLITVNTNANTIVDSFNTGITRGARYTISSTTATDSHLAEVHVTQFGTAVVTTTYGNISTGTNTITYYANVNGSTVNLLANGTTSSQVRIQRIYFKV